MSKISKNYDLSEFLSSETAERYPKILSKQKNPPANVISNLSYLANNVLDKITIEFGVKPIVTSGYRCPDLNKLVGSSPSSQHLQGEAADIQIRGLPFPLTELETKIYSLTGKEINKRATPNLFLFAWICINLNKLDIDQVIHEYGEGPGRPAWVHVAASRNKNARRISIATSKGIKDLTLVQALSLGA